MTPLMSGMNHPQPRQGDHHGAESGADQPPTGGPGNSHSDQRETDCAQEQEGVEPQRIVRCLW